MPGLSLSSRLDGAVGGKTATAFERAFGMTLPAACARAKQWFQTND